MKKIYFALLALASVEAFAQVVHIPDANFKNALVNTNCAYLNSNTGEDQVDVDVNNDGEIQISEAQDVNYLDIRNLSISSLEGIDSFVHLQILDCAYNNLTSLDLSVLTELFSVNCGYNQLTTLNIANSEVMYLSCGHNLLSHIEFNPNYNIGGDFFELDLSYNLLTSWDFPANMYRFVNLKLSGNPMTSLIIPYVQIYNSEGPIRINNMPNLIYLESHAGYISANGNKYPILDVKNCPNLEYLNVKNGIAEFKFPTIQLGSDTYPYPYGNFVGNCPALNRICLDDFEASAAFQFYGNTNVSFSEYCNYAPTGGYNLVVGNVQFDLEGNGCSLQNHPGIAIPVLSAYNTSISGSSYTNNNGYYQIYSNGILNRSYQPNFENPYFTVSPASYTTHFSTTGNTETANFCIAPNGVHPDLEIMLLPLTAARPGFDANYQIVYKNKGNQLQSGNVTFNFDNSLSDLINTNPVFEASTPGSISWNFEALAPFESRVIDVRLNVNSPQETPAVNIGDILNMSAVLQTAAVDDTPNDNNTVMHQTVVGSIDPNDKLILEGSVIDILKVGECLHYLVRFQNTGTAAAENVVVKDLLSSNLDPHSLQVISASHPYRADLYYGKLEFIFQNINLPASSQDEPGSHGYVAFKIKPKNTVVIGSVIENTASIYFDFNFPVVTNTTATTVVTLGTQQFSNGPFAIFPNPAQNTIHIKTENNTVIQSISLYNLLGQLIKSVPSDNPNVSTIIDVSSLKAGTYLIEVTSNQGKATQKFVKY